jgi:hypothetical protein
MPAGPWGPAQQAEVAIPLCDWHRRNATLDDICPQEMWEALRDAFAKNGKQMLPRELVQVDFRHAEFGFLN